MSDQHNYKVLGLTNPIAETPNLDLFAKSNVFVENCYCNAPLCVPSRLSFITGKYPSQIRVYGNRNAIKSSMPNLSGVLSKKVDCFLIGKMHFYKGQNFSFQSLGPDDCNQRTELREFKYKTKNLYEPGLPRWKVFGDSEVLNHDREVVKRVKSFLSRREKKPFFLVVGLLSPHPPLTLPSKKYLDKFMDRVEFHRPRHPVDDIGSGIVERRYGDVRIDDESLKKILTSYYGLTFWMDERIGEILDSIYASRHADDTEIIYTSDHGDMLGSHGILNKGCLYEGAVRVPLMFSGKKDRLDKVCSLLDVSRTIAKRFGVEFGEGRNLDDIYSDSWPNTAFSVHSSGHLPGTQFMVRKNQYKYIYSAGSGVEQLYNLKSNPNETKNVIHRERLREDMHLELSKMFGDMDQIHQDLLK